MQCLLPHKSPSPPQASHSFVTVLKLQSSLKGTYNLYNSDYPDSIKKHFSESLQLLKKCQQFCLMGEVFLRLPIEKQKAKDTDGTLWKIKRTSWTKSRQGLSSEVLYHWYITEKNQTNKPKTTKKNTPKPMQLSETYLIEFYARSLAAIVMRQIMQLLIFFNFFIYRH